MNCMQRKFLCAHTFDARPDLPATSRGRAVVEAAHAFGRPFAGQFTAACNVDAKVRKSSLLLLTFFRGVARNGDTFRKQQREMS